MGASKYQVTRSRRPEYCPKCGAEAREWHWYADDDEPLNECDVELMCVECAEHRDAVDLVTQTDITQEIEVGQTVTFGTLLGAA